MIIEIDPQSIDNRKIQQIVKELNKGSIAIIPTDTIYAVVCKLNSTKGLAALALFKKEKISKLKCSLLFHDFSQLASYTAPIDRPIFRLLKNNLPGPFTFILKSSNQVGKFFSSSKVEIGMRIPNNEITKEILCSLDAPLASTSLHHIEDEIRVYYSEPTEIYEHFSDKIDVIVLGGTGLLTHSTIVDCTKGDAIITRQGLGILSE
jgi:tRNA threonylcarbamoyl adenosine modification protein (Sua5/YciO/YrdC/YwlC family)